MNGIRLVAMAAALAAATRAQASNGMRTIGFGPIQDSMGGASVGAPLEATTMLTNPAGLSGMSRGAELAVTYFNQLASYDAGVTSGTIGYSERAHPWYLPTIAVVWPVGGSLTLGLGTGCGGPAGVSQAFYPGSTRTSTWNRRITPAASYQLSRGLSVGVTANIMWDGLNYEAPGGGSLPRGKDTEWGLGATVGLYYTPSDVFTLGAAYESKGFFRDFEWTIPSQEWVDPSTGNLVTVPGGTERLDFDLPQVATVGASVRPVDGLLLAADLEWIDWSGTRGRNEPALDTDPLLTGAHAWNMSWSDQLVVKLGAQYAMTPAFKVRAGYNYGKRPVDASRAFENIDFPAITEHHLTMGVGYSSPCNKLTVNLAGVYAPRAKLSGSNPAQGISSYEVEAAEITLDLGVAVRF